MNHHYGYSELFQLWTDQFVSRVQEFPKEERARLWWILEHDLRTREDPKEQVIIKLKLAVLERCRLEEEKPRTEVESKKK